MERKERQQGGKRSPSGAWRDWASVARLLAAIGFALGVALAAAQAHSTPAEDRAAQKLGVPPELRPWVPWVLAEAEDRACPLEPPGRRCVWPSQLELELGERSGRFRLSLTSHRRGFVVLPGSQVQWPQRVRVDGKAVVVLERGGRPAASVNTGRHRIAGEWSWSKIPEYLEIPPTAALVAARRGGKPLSRVERVGPGRLRLGEGVERESSAEEALELVVFRRIEDGVPLRVRTRIELSVAGPPREVRLPSPLLLGSEAEAVHTKLTARWSEQGDLIVGALPGAHSLEIVARRLEPLGALVAAAAVAPWPEQEIWAFQAAPSVREVTVSGAPGIDPSRTGLPPAWQALPAYRVRPGQGLRFEPLRRGQPEPGQSLLSLRRRLWLDLDGTGFTAEDTLSGELRRAFRLDLAAASLQRARLSGEPQLVTLHPETGATGVELRQAEVRLQGVFRLPAGGPLPAVGWSEGVQSLSAELALPPGFKLLAATGVDHADSSWLSHWRLWDFFFVLVLSVGLLRLAHWRLSAALLVTLVLTHGRPLAPHWVWLLLLGGLLLSQLPAQRLRWVGPAFRGLAVLSFALVTLRFCLVEARTALFPQLDSESQAPEGGGFAARMDAVPAGAAMDSAPPQSTAVRQKREAMPVEAAEERLATKEDAAVGFGGAKLASPKAYRSSLPGAGLSAPPQDAVVQTGPALPIWQFTRSPLRWSGPVQRDQTFRLYLAPPWLTRSWAALRALGCVWVGAWLVRCLYRPRRPPQPPSSGPGSSSPSGGASRAAPPSSVESSAIDTEPGGAGPPAGAAPGGTRLARGMARGMARGIAVALALCSAGGFSSQAAAAPSAELLRELKARLLRPAPCAPQCVAVPRAALRVDATGLQLDLELEVGASTSLALPGPASAWAPTQVEVDGKSASLALGTGGHIRVQLDAGFHRLRAIGPVQGDEAVLTFPRAPGTLALALEGWQADGLDPEGRVVGALRLARTTRPLSPSATDPSAGAAEVALPRHWLLHRSIELGQQWVVHSRLERTAAQSGPQAPAAVVAVPLLEGESVSDARVAAEKGEVMLRLARGENSKTWTSRLAPREVLALKAPSATARRTERWQVRCGIVWHCEISGLAPVRRFGRAPEGTQGWLPEFWPWPGETLRLRLRRPEAAAGSAATIERAVLTVQAGTRSARSTLELTVNNTSAAREVITLPQGAAVERLRIDGRERPIPARTAEAVVLLEPGDHQVSLTFQEERGWGPLFAVPQVGLSRPAHNVRVELDVPRDRWLLWARGPRWGPAIVFWPLLALTLGFAALLARVPQTPLSFLQWSLLGLGLVSRPAPLGVAIVVWLLAVKFRAGRSIDSRWGYNALQLALGLGTVVATGLIVAAVYSGLVVRPDMQVSGAGSHGFHLSWYLDHTSAAASGALPSPRVWSAPLWVYRALMLLWALWLAQAWVRWLSDAFGVLTAGPLWKVKHRPPKSA